MNMWTNIIGPLNITWFAIYLDPNPVTTTINLHHCTISIQVMMTFELGITYACGLFYPPHSHHLFLYMKLSIRILKTSVIWPHHPVEGEGKLSIGLSLRLNSSSPNMMTAQWNSSNVGGLCFAKSCRGMMPTLLWHFFRALMVRPRG